MTTVTWRLLDRHDQPLPHQPRAGSPLELQYDTTGQTHLARRPAEKIAACECSADTLIVSVSITPDDPKIPRLSAGLSTPVKVGRHPGRFMWQDYAAKRVVLTFALPEIAGNEWIWDFRNKPPIALRIKVKAKR